MDSENQPSHERVAMLHGAYTAFIAALIASLISGDGHIKTENWAISLWVLSLPWLCSFLLIDFAVRKKQKRAKSATRGLMQLLGYGFSNLGTVALIAHYSWITAILFLASISICIIYVSEVVSLGGRESFKEL